jgi:2-methylcitrate dehydratase PrpD
MDQERQDVDRRSFLAAIGGATLSSGCRFAASSQRSVPSAPAGNADDEQTTDVTQRLARFVVSAERADLSQDVRKAASRTLLNWIGCAIGGSREEAVEMAVEAVAPFSGAAQASVMGRRERLDVLNAALINGISSHVLDFDDTHQETLIHPGGPVLSGLLALAEYRATTGPEFVNAMVLGVEVACRIGSSVMPAHYDAGWHITGTAGVFGAAAAAGKLLHLSEAQMVWALGLAATQPVGLQSMFGTMTKSFHPGRAAQSGLTAALLASRNFTASERSLEASKGWGRVLSTARDYRRITDSLGDTYAISSNAFKPFACGLVMHPVIDACIQLRNGHKLQAQMIERVELRVHPRVLQLTGQQEPQDGLQGKFSIYHAAAVALIDGAGGMRQFSDEAVRQPSVIALRRRVEAVVDGAIHEDQARVVITTSGGGRVERFIEHAVGGIERPMSDADLTAKFTDLVELIIPGQVQQLSDLCWNVERLSDIAVLAGAARMPPSSK